MGLLTTGQGDFGAGSQLAVAPHLIDDRGFYLAENTLLNEDGSGYKRGGSDTFGKAAFGSAGRYVWEGHLLPGRRTLIASTSAFGVLAADAEGSEILNLGGAGFTGVPKLAVAFRDLLFIGGGVIYGGSRKTADYSTGTVKVVKGSKTVAGTGTAWTANVDVGMLFRLSGASQRIYVVAAVKSNTEIELNEAYEGASEETKTYTLKRLEAATAPYKSAAIYAVSGNRLIVCEGNDVWQSALEKPHLYEDTIFPQETKVQNVHHLEEGIEIIAAQTIGVDKLLVFHTGGLTTITNLAKSIVDGLGNSPRRIDVFSRDLVAWGATGIAGYRGALVVPAIDNVYLVDGVSDIVALADSIIPRYRQRLLEGMTPGVAWVAREHYFLPLLSSGGVPEDLLVCRLDKPFSSRNKTLYPWTFLSGAGGRVAAAAVRHPETPGELPRILAAAANGQLVNLVPYFEPSESTALDHDGSVPLWSLTTRDFGAGDEAIHRWRRLELFYELWALAEGAEPGITAEVGLGVRKSGLSQWDEVTWDDFEWSGDEETEFKLLEGVAPPNAGDDSELIQNAKGWPMKARGRYTRYRFQCADPVAKLVIRGLQTFPAEVGGVRLTRAA